VVVLHVPATWHASLAAHTTGLLPVQTAVVHVSVCVHGLPSLHAVPSGAPGFEHVPSAGLHDPATWHWSLAAHVTGFIPAQMPLAHASVWVQALPSLQVVPSGSVGVEQVPLNGLHDPAAWHWSTGAHVTGFAPVHVPAVHVSACVHGLPSLQVVPSGSAGFEHVPDEVLQLPTPWH
jgi:hypothetical protein